MKTVPLISQPAQSLSIVLAGQACRINLYSLNTPGDILNRAIPIDDLTGYPALYMDLLVAGEPVITCRICRNLIRVLLDAQYYGFIGDFIFVDSYAKSSPTDGQDPVYTGLGTQFQLVYLEATDLQ